MSQASQTMPPEEPRSEEDRFRLLVDRVKDYAIFMLDPKGKIESWNEGAQRIKGYKADEIIGKTMESFYLPEDVKRGHPSELLGIAEREGRVEEEGWRIRKDGSKFWADVVITALRDDKGRPRGFGKVTRDLTERREAEIALSELAGKMLQVKDDEQRRISRELHDSTSPLLTGLIAKLYNAKARSKGLDPALVALIDDSLTSAETTSTVIRSVSSLLHPPLLDESGLAASLRWYVNAVIGRHDMRVDLDMPERIERLPRETEIALFRIVQEGLGNVVRNLGAKRVSVCVKSDRDGLEIQIQGRGQDIPPGTMEELRLSRGEVGIGVAGMRERMRQLGGSLSVSSADGGLLINAVLKHNT